MKTGRDDAAALLTDDNFFVVAAAQYLSLTPGDKFVGGPGTNTVRGGEMELAYEIVYWIFLCIRVWHAAQLLLKDLNC
jgi:hypothetical protein